MDAQGKGQGILAWEAEINERVARLYGLSDAETRLLDSAGAHEALETVEVIAGWTPDVRPDPSMLDRLKSLLASSDHADIAVGYLFISGFNAVSEELGKLDRVRLLVGRTDRATLDEVASGLQQTEALTGAGGRR